MDGPSQLMEVRNETEGNDICEQLRAVGIKCFVAPLPDVNSIAPVFAIEAPTVLMVLVNESDMDQARAVITEYQKGLRRTGESQA